jgi:hypothetical protein
MSLKYKYFGVTEDGSTQVIADGFDSKGNALVSAIRSATHLRCHSNPRHYIRLEIQDYHGCLVEEYKDYDSLKCGKD